MQLDELRKNMSTLEQVLAKTSADIRINVEVSETAQSRILRKYHQAAKNCAIVAIVFCCLWIGNVSPDKLPNLYKGFITVLCGAGAVWYAYLSIRLKKIEIARLKPSALISETTTIKLLTLAGETVFGLALAVFFTLLLSEMIATNLLVFWLIAGCLAAGLTWSALYVWPRFIRLFSDLNSIKE